MGNFWVRTITGLSMVFILLATLWFSGWVFMIVFLIINIFGLWEFYGIITNEHCQPQKYYGIAAGGLLYAATSLACLVPSPLADQHWVSCIPLIILIPLFFLSFIIEIYRKKSNPLINIAVTIVGFLYISLPFSLLIFFTRTDELHFWGMPVILVGYFLFTWINDTGAYLYGNHFGKHKFFERISPKKTWEGTIAGAILTLLSAFILYFIVNDLPLIDWLVLACLVLFFGTHGDLVESLLKRSLKIKDSGNILPGHGGILDRFDTILISAPFVFLYFFIRHVT
jgi:phosphatidate cytidylyltransferase